MALACLGSVFGPSGPEAVEDDLQVLRVGNRLFAVSGTSGSTATLRLRVREDVVRLESRGLVGLAVTSDRLLAAGLGSGSWSELELRVEERGNLPGRYDVLVGDRAILVVLPNRLAAFSSRGGGWVELELTPLEDVRWRVLDESVAAVLTTRRAIGFSHTGGFSTIRFGVSERNPQISSQDRSVTLVTNRRTLVFTTAAGWREIRRLINF